MPRLSLGQYDHDKFGEPSLSDETLIVKIDHKEENSTYLEANLFRNVRALRYPYKPLTNMDIERLSRKQNRAAQALNSLGLLSPGLR
jgi:hypothetical protein